MGASLSASASLADESEPPVAVEEQLGEGDPFSAGVHVNFPDVMEALRCDADAVEEDRPSIDTLASSFPVDLPMRNPPTGRNGREAAESEARAQRQLDHWFGQEALRKALKQADAHRALSQQQALILQHQQQPVQQPGSSLGGDGSGGGDGPYGRGGAREEPYAYYDRGGGPPHQNDESGSYYSEEGYRDGGRPRRSVPRDTLRALLDGARPRDASTLRSILLEGVSLQLDAGALKALVQECAQVAADTALAAAAAHAPAETGPRYAHGPAPPTADAGSQTPERLRARGVQTEEEGGGGGSDGARARAAAMYSCALSQLADAGGWSAAAGVMEQVWKLQAATQEQLDEAAATLAERPQQQPQQQAQQQAQQQPPGVGREEQPGIRQGLQQEQQQLQQEQQQAAKALHMGTPREPLHLMPVTAAAAAAAAGRAAASATPALAPAGAYGIARPAAAQRQVHAQVDHGPAWGLAHTQTPASRPSTSSSPRVGGGQAGGTGTFTLPATVGYSPRARAAAPWQHSGSAAGTGVRHAVTSVHAAGTSDPRSSPTRHRPVAAAHVRVLPPTAAAVVGEEGWEARLKRARYSPGGPGGTAGGRAGADGGGMAGGTTAGIGGCGSRDGNHSGMASGGVLSGNLLRFAPPSLRKQMAGSGGSGGYAPPSLQKRMVGSDGSDGGGGGGTAAPKRPRNALGSGGGRGGVENADPRPMGSGGVGFALPAHLLPPSMQQQQSAERSVGKPQPLQGGQQAYAGARQPLAPLALQQLPGANRTSAGACQAQPQPYAATPKQQWARPAPALEGGDGFSPSVASNDAGADETMGDG
ncbi:hypothetical protein FOA52_015422 [Chlamydomonas sp. UWO 241]|nr:hypothetical protein FOA52_015422 [Chlamydomonas sp. UWO 241]